MGILAYNPYSSADAWSLSLVQEKSSIGGKEWSQSKERHVQLSGLCGEIAQEVYTFLPTNSQYVVTCSNIMWLVIVCRLSI